MSLGAYSKWEERYRELTVAELQQKVEYLHNRVLIAEQRNDDLVDKRFVPSPPIDPKDL